MGKRLIWTLRLCPYLPFGTYQVMPFAARPFIRVNRRFNLRS